ncbi:MerR family transcriptional regulator [Streptomyces sp. NPDC005438]|uniref:MerR family transcriptional regulator n=1 Tax=Streptomyces sp. NPDC005438 TaxID=3156880 RepID=UPI0033BBD9BC
MRIGELASAAGVSVRSLRYYEEQGLLTPTRTSGGQRRYGQADLERVTFVQRLLAAGLSSRTIAELMPCVDAPSQDHSLVALERMEQERDRLSTHIDELLRTRESLEELISAALSQQGRPTTAAARG